jgi:hypothetical protein
MRRLSSIDSPVIEDGVLVAEYESLRLVTICRNEVPRANNFAAARLRGK